MSVHGRIRVFGITAAVAAVAVAVGSGVAPALTSSSAPKKITPSGVGGVKLGKTYIQLRRQDLVKKIQKGCPLGGPNTRGALLKAPLKGGVNFTLSNPRKVTAITIRGGARARGVGIGSKIPAIKAAFPKAKVDHNTDQVFGITLVTIPKNGGGRLAFAVDTTTKRTTLIGIPGIPFCE
jgi:hypothetical protein